MICHVVCYLSSIKWQSTFLFGLYNLVCLVWLILYLLRQLNFSLPHSGALIGHPVENLRVVLIDGAAHAVDSSELAFKMASIYAFRQVLLFLLSRVLFLNNNSHILLVIICWFIHMRWSKSLIIHCYIFNSVMQLPDRLF